MEDVTWRERAKSQLAFPLCRLWARSTRGRVYDKAEPHAEEWLLIEWPSNEAEPPNTGYRRCLKRPRSSSGEDGKTPLDHRRDYEN